MQYGYFLNKCAVAALVLLLTQGVAAPSQAEQSPIFSEFQTAGMARGNRGDGQANRFEPFLETYRGFAPASQDFILRAFSAGKLTVAPDGESVAYANGQLAANLIRMTQDIEGMALYVETRVIPTSRDIPRASDDFDRMIRKLPDVVAVLTPDVRSRIMAMEEQVLVTLGEENEAQGELLAGLKAENEALDRLNSRLESLLAALGG
jgi:hypothetical protein